jgi:hypothetical protein
MKTPNEKTRTKAIAKARAMLREKYRTLMYVKVKNVNGRCYCGETGAIELSAKCDGKEWDWQRVNICKNCADD